MGKVATSPLPARVSPPLLSGGEESEVAHFRAKWLRHPCRLGDPHRFRAGGEIRSGPQVGKVGTSPLPSRVSPPLQGGGEESEVAHKWAKWLRHPCRLGDPHRFRAGGKIRSGPLVGKVATSPLPSRGSPPLQNEWEKSEVAHLWVKWLRQPCRHGDPHRFRAGGKITSGPLVGKVATSPLPSRESPPLQSGGQNQKWPTCGQSGYVTPAVSGIPTASDRGAKSEVAHLWAKWLRHPCRLGDPHRFRAGVGKSEVAHLWAKWLRHPSRLGDPHRRRAGGRNQDWPTCWQTGYVTPAVSGFSTATGRGAKSEVAHLWATWLRHPCRLGDPHRCRAGGKIRSGPLVGKVTTSPLPSRGSPPLQSGGQNQRWPTLSKVATPPLPSRGSPPLQSGGRNQKWPTYGQSGYVTRAISGIPTASERGEKSEVAHKWAKWLRHPCRLGDPHRFRAGGKITSGPLVGKVAMSPQPSRGSPPLPSGGENQKWPTCGQSDYVTPAVSGIPTAAERGAKSEVAHFEQSGYATPAVSGIPTASERGEKSEVAHLWAKWLRQPCRLGDPHRFRAGGKIRSGPQVGKVATSPLPSGGSPPLQSGGQNHKWPTCGQGGYVTPAVSGIPTGSERGATSEMAHLCSGGDPRDGSGDVATLPISGALLILPPDLKRWGSPRRQG